jgi:hypothetical protein
MEPRLALTQVAPGLGSTGARSMRTHFVSRLFGAVFIEYHTARGAAPPFYAHQSRAGEHLFWVGRLHVIYTPARIVFGAPAGV